MEKMSLGGKLAFLRQERGYAQKEIAPLLNLSISTISNYENGVHSPDLATLCRFADFYGVTTDYLLGRTEYRFPAESLNHPVTEEYTVLDIVDTILACERSGKIEHLISYAKFLSKS